MVQLLHNDRYHSGTPCLGSPLLGGERRELVTSISGQLEESNKKKNLLTTFTSHDLQPEIDAIVEVMWQKTDKLSRHHPVQSTLCHPSIILVTRKNLERRCNMLSRLKAGQFPFKLNVFRR